MRSLKKTVQLGFTLVELLIVVIILAILAAIVVPQFAASTQDASDAALRSNLAAVRSAIDLYRQQHNGAYPGAVTAVAGAPCTATSGTGDASTAGTQATAFKEQLTLYTNRAGQACSSPVGGLFPYGPYLRSSELPVNPVTEPASNTLLAVSAGDLNMGGDAADGWKFDIITGRFIANTDLNDSNNTAYDTY